MSSITSLLKAFDRFQQRHKPLALPLAVVKKFGDDSGGNLSSLIAYYAFFSLFPLLLVFVSLLGFVLQGDPSAQQDVLNSALKQFPVIGEGLKAGSLKGSGVALAIGIIGTLLSGLGVTLAAQNAINQVYAVPHRARPNFLLARLRGLGVLAVLGILQLVSTVASGLVSGGFGGAALTVAGITVSLLLNLVLFFATFRLLTDGSIPTRAMWPGIITATILWEILQAVGGIYISHVVKGASNVYGTFATVIGLFTWLALGARIVVYAAEVNTVLSRRLWPRSLFEPPVGDADKRALSAIAKTEERIEGQQIDVSFEPHTERAPES